MTLSKFLEEASSRLCWTSLINSRHSVEKFLYCGGGGYSFLTLMSPDPDVLVEFGVTGNVGKFCRAEAADHDPALELVTRLLLLPAGLQLGQSLNRVLLVPFQVFPKSVI